MRPQTDSPHTSSHTSSPRQQPEGGGAAGLRAYAEHAPASSQMVSLDALAALASRMSDGLCALTAEGRVWYANPALRALLGRSKAELLGQRIDEFRYDKGENDSADGVGAIRGPWTASQRVSESQWRRADGGVFAARYTLEPLASAGEPGGAILLMTPTALPTVSAERAEDAEERAAAGRWVEVIEAVADLTLTRLDARDLMEALLNRLRPALGLENAAFFLLNEAGDQMDPAVIAGPGREFLRKIHVPLTGPLVSGVMRTRQPVVVNGARSRMRSSGLFPPEMLDIMRVHSMLLTPLVVEDQVIGMLYLGAPDLDHFTLDDIRLARVASARVALAVEGARSREAEARAREEAMRGQRRLVTLSQANETLVGPLEPTEIAKSLVSFIVPSHADACALYLIEEDGMVRRVAVRGPDHPEARDAEGPPAPAYAAVKRALERLPQEMLSLELPPGAGESLPGARTSGAARIESAAVTQVLVESHNHAVGALFLIEGAGRLLDPEDLRLVQGVARRAAIGLEIARLYGELGETLRHVSESAMQLDTIFDATDACLYVTDARGRFQRLNAYGARMLGLSEAETAPSPSQLHAAFELRDERGAPIPPHETPLALAREQNITIERRVTVHRLGAGDDTPALARCAPLRNGSGQVTGVVGVMMDITGIHEIERQRDEFLGIVSHELKTPMTTLKILAQMLAKRMKQSDEPRAQEQAERMSAAIKRIERLVTDLLDITLIQDGKLAMSFTVCDLGSICRDAAREQELVSDRVIQVALPDRESLPIHADVERLWQVITNLLSNALKYSPANTPVALRVREAGALYHVAVEDRGLGVPPEERERVFQRFYRASAVRVQTGSGVGLGLGLYISREIVRAHGGDIWVESRPGQGSIFTFSIPRAGHAVTENLA